MTDQNQSGISRRTLAKGAAWAAPAVAVAAAAPRVAASPNFTATFGTACKVTAGCKQYYIPLTICNNGSAGSVDLSNWRVSGTTNAILQLTSGLPADGVVALGEKECRTYHVFLGQSGNLANGQATFSVDYAYEAAGGKSGTWSASYPALAPCKGISCPAGAAAYSEPVSTEDQARTASAEETATPEPMARTASVEQTPTPKPSKSAEAKAAKETAKAEAKATAKAAKAAATPSATPSA